MTCTPGWRRSSGWSTCSSTCTARTRRARATPARTWTTTPPLSISARFVSNPDQHDDWPLFDYDASRQINVAVYEALQGRGNSPYGKVTLYPQSINLPGTALGSFALRGSATILFESTGFSSPIRHKQMGMKVKQIEVGMTGLIDAVVDGSWRDLDPERYEAFPERRNAPAP